MSFGGGGFFGGGGGGRGDGRSALGGRTREVACRSPGSPRRCRPGVDQLLADEPDHGEPTARFSYRAERRGADAADAAGDDLPPLASRRRRGRCS